MGYFRIRVQCTAKCQKFAAKLPKKYLWLALNLHSFSVKYFKLV